RVLAADAQEEVACSGKVSHSITSTFNPPAKDLVILAMRAQPTRGTGRSADKSRIQSTTSAGGAVRSKRVAPRMQDQPKSPCPTPSSHSSTLRLILPRSDRAALFFSR